MIREPETEGNEGQRRIHRARRWVDRRAADVEIRNPVNPTVRISYAFLWIRAHSQRAHVVPTTADEARPAHVIAQQPVFHLDAAGVGAPHLPTEQLVEHSHRMLIQRRYGPVETAARNS